MGEGEWTERVLGKAEGEDTVSILHSKGVILNNNKHHQEQYWLLEQMRSHETYFCVSIATNGVTIQTIALHVMTTIMAEVAGKEQALYELGMECSKTMEVYQRNGRFWTADWQIQFLRPVGSSKKL